ncbi:MAG: hypothetical protein IAE64_06160 [Flavobacteriales bacterium]|nr:hypothetical protein [Flavobacteriales bacterium]
MSDLFYSDPSPNEALHAFMDGELEPTHEQKLFNELAANPSLRNEMKDVLTLRNAVMRDVAAAPAITELPQIAAMTGVAGSGASAAGSSGLFIPMLFSAGGILAGLMIAIFLLGTTGGDTLRQSGADRTNGLAGLHHEPPVSLLVSTPTDTIRTVRVIYRTQGQQQADRQLDPSHSGNLTSRTVQPSLTPVDHNQAEADVPELPADATVQDEITPAVLTAHLPKAARSTMMNAIGSPAHLLNPVSQIPNAIFKVRSLAQEITSTNPVPSSVQQAFLPNTSYALVTPLSDHHHVGVEIGTESFRQQFTGTNDQGQLQRITQTPVLLWFGGTYEYVGSTMLIPGLSPYGLATLAYAYGQGPVARSSVGLSYMPVGPLRFYAGIDASILGYSHQNTWFTSSNIGFTYGIGIDIP